MSNGNDQIKEGDNVATASKHGVGIVRYIEGKYAAVLFGKTLGTFLLADLERVEMKTEEEVRKANAKKKA